jgi:cation transport ATPase
MKHKFVFRETPSQGLLIRWNQKTIRLGKASFALDLNQDTPFCEDSVLYLSCDYTQIAYFILKTDLRPQAQSTTQKLSKKMKQA